MLAPLNTDIPMLAPVGGAPGSYVRWLVGMSFPASGVCASSDRVAGASLTPAAGAACALCAGNANARSAPVCPFSTHVDLPAGRPDGRIPIRQHHDASGDRTIAGIGRDVTLFLTANA